MHEHLENNKLWHVPNAKLLYKEFLHLVSVYVEFLHTITKLVDVHV